MRSRSLAGATTAIAVLSAVVWAGFGAAVVGSSEPTHRAAAQEPNPALTTVSAQATTGSPAGIESRMLPTDGAPAPRIELTPALTGRPATVPGGLPTLGAVVLPASPTPVVTPSATPAPSATPTPTPTPLTGKEARRDWASKNYDMASGPNHTPRVVLTYDDCPNSLEAFKAMIVGAEEIGVALALFPTGECIEAGRFQPRFARAHGHYVFNHSVTHPQLPSIKTDDVLAELGAPGVVTSWGRPPFGDTSRRVREAYAFMGMRIWLWDLDTNDWDGHKSQWTIISEVVEGARKGSTVLMHMQENGFTPETVSELRTRLKAKNLYLCENRGPTDSAPLTLDC